MISSTTHTARPTITPRRIRPGYRTFGCSSPATGRVYFRPNKEQMAPFHCPQGTAPRHASLSSPRRRNQRDNFALVSTINAKILDIHSDDTVLGIDLAHSDQT